MIAYTCERCVHWGQCWETMQTTDSQLEFLVYFVYCVGFNQCYPKDKSTTVFIPLNGIAVHVQKTAHNINWQEARILARENNWGRIKKGPWGPWDPTKKTQDEPWCWSTSGLIVDPLCSSEERKSRDRKCLGGKPKPYLRRVTPKAPRLLKTTHRVETSRWRILFTRLRF